MLSRRSAVIVFAIVVGCAPIDLTSTLTPSPSASLRTNPPILTVRPTPVPTSPVVVSPAPIARVAVSNAPFDASLSGLLFRVPGEDTLRAVAWDGSRDGVLGARIPVDVFFWHQSPDGSRYELNGTIYDRSGHPFGDLPWPNSGDGVFTWSHDSSIICKARPAEPNTGSPLRLEIAAPGGSARVVATIGTFSNNAGYPVLACDTATDRALVATLGQGLFAGHMVVVRLSTGAVVRSVDLGKDAVTSWVAATADGQMYAESTRTTMNAAAVTTIRNADDGSAVATLTDFEAHGFSGDGRLVYGRGPSSAVEVREAKTGRVLWTAGEVHSLGALAGPAGQIAVAVGTATDAREPVDIYLVGPAGAVLLPGVRPASLGY